MSVASRVSVGRRGLGRGVASCVDLRSVAMGHRFASNVDFVIVLMWIFE